METDAGVQRGETNPIGYTGKQAEKEWFDDECENLNELTKQIQIRMRTANRKHTQKPNRKRGTCLERSQVKENSGMLKFL
jgi:hypothetical protein